MYFEYIVNQKKSSCSQFIEDSSLCELQCFINSNKSYIMEIVYDYLNTKKEKNKQYYKFMSLIEDIKEEKEKSNYCFHYIDLSNNIIQQQDINHFRTCFIEKESKTQKIQSMFRVEKKE